MDEWYKICAIGLNVVMNEYDICDVYKFAIANMLRSEKMVTIL